MGFGGPADPVTRAATRPLRFCLLTTFYPPWNFGGDGIQVERLARALADRGHRVTVVCSPGVHRLLSRQRAPEPAPYPGIEVVTLRDSAAARAGEYLAGRPIGTRRALERILGRGYDVIHFHNPSLLGAPALFGLGEGMKLYTAHEQWLLCPSHVLWKADGRVCEEPPCWSCEIAHRRPPQLWRRLSGLERWLSHLDTLIVPSRASARLHQRFAAQVRLEVINHFIPEPPRATELSAGDLDGVGRGPYFLYAGRFEPIKGVSTAIDAFRASPSQRLVIAGDGAEARRLRRRARDLPSVTFTGWLEPKRLDALYRGALAVVVPTLGHEAFSLVCAEAFAHGKPAIVHRFGALEEIVADTGAGIAYGSPAELEAAIDLIAGDSELRVELGRRALAAARERFSAQAHLSSYMSLIARQARLRGDDELSRAAEAAAGRAVDPPDQAGVAPA